MRSSMVDETKVTLSNGEVVTVAPYDVPLVEFVSALEWFESVRPSWLAPLSVRSESLPRRVAWMR